MEQEIEEKGKIDENQAIKWIIQLLKALAKIHDKKIILGDIKPA